MQQQTISHNITGPEQSQEEVQLTELLPVKQSRIKENVFKNADATDALKALMSLSGDCDDSESFDLQEFNFYKNIEQFDHQSSKHRRMDGQRKRSMEKTRNGARNVDLNKEKNSEMAEKKVRDDRKIARAKTLKRKLVKSSKKKDESNYGTNGKLSKREIARYDDDDDDEQLYLDLEKKDCFKDEVYVYRQEPLDLASSSEPEESEATSHKDLCKNYLTTDGKGKFADKVSDIDDKNEKCKSKADDDIIDKENPEKELRLKMDAIIQANYLLEHEKNDVASSKVKVMEFISTSSTAASINAKNDDGSINNSAEPKKKKRKKRIDQVKQLKDQGDPQEDQENPQKEQENLQKDEENSEKTFCCVVCDARFKGSGGLRNHYKVVHGAGPLYKCNDCGKEFPLKERLKLHVRTHTGFKPYKCPECNKSFARGGQLVQHRRTHSQDRPYRCKLCSNTFTCSANLVLHLKRHNGQKDHKCDLCGRGFVRRDALKKHLECLHRDVKSFICAICNKTFKGHLPQHMRTHARDRPHGCATCGQRFAQKSQLTVHQRTHSGQRPFRCLVCWQAFAHSTALKLHTRRHTGERPFKCSECNAGFTQLPHWKKHMKCIHGKTNPYGCKHCKSFFRIKTDLDNHVKTCHSGMETEDDEDDYVFTGPAGDSEVVEKITVTARYNRLTVGKMRLLLAVLLKRISKQERLSELGFGKRLIDEVLQDSLVSAGKEPVYPGNGMSELEALTRNLEIFLEWTVPKEHLEKFRKMKKSPGEILETLTAT